MTAPLHVGMDVVFWVADSGGAGTYARELIHALHRVEPGTQVTAWVGRGAPEELETTDWGGETRIVRLPLGSTGSPVHLAYELAVLGLDARRRRADVVHGLAYCSPLVAPGVARIVTIHDLTWHHQPQATTRLARAMFSLLTPLCGHSADRVITGSAAARDDLVATARLPRAKIDVVWHGVSVRPGAPAVAEPQLRLRLGLPPGAPVILFVGQITAHKNLAALVRALPELAPEARLVLVGKASRHSAELRSLASALGVSERLALPGFVEAAELEGLYALASCFVLPSTNEGFGLPLLEAMSRGVPVACSDASSLPEVAGGAALLFDPHDPASVAGAVARILGEPALRADLIARGRARAAALTWDETARGTLASYRRAIARV